MKSRWRISFLGAVALVTSCVGGPVSDLPHSGSDDGDSDHGHNIDGGASSGGLDAGVPATPRDADADPPDAAADARADGS